MTPYAGRWIALIDEQVVGDGHTAEEALQVAREQRPRERVIVSFVEPPGEEPLPFLTILDRLRSMLRENMPVYLVGGAVRDALLGQINVDLDFVMRGEAIQLAFSIGDAVEAPAFVLDKERDIGRVVIPEDGITLDFARFRGPDLTADLRARDFTINALALPATAYTRAAIIDPTGGLQDLDAKQIRLIEDDALVNDPVRTLRAVRLAASLDFTIMSETRAAITQSAPLLADVSAERKRDEFLKILMTLRPDEAMEELQELGLLAVLLPEVASLRGIAQSSPHYEDVLSHTWSVLRWLTRLEAALFADRADSVALAQAGRALEPYVDQLHDYFNRAIDGALDGWVILRLAALFHDVGKKATYEVDDGGQIRFLGHDKLGALLTGERLKQLCLSNEAINQVKQIVAGHMRPLSLAQAQGDEPTRRAVYRYFLALGSNGLDVALLALADHLATFNGAGEQSDWEVLVGLVAELYRDYFERHEETIKPAPLVNGRDLISILGMKTGPEIGRILRLVEEAQAAGEINTRDEALRFAQDKLG